ncbi:hypothetical protein DFH29DRAFT_923242, partial [Suillus ampliporus]
MSNSPEPPQQLTEQLKAKKVLRVIGAGICLIAYMINSFCIAIVFIHLATTIPALKLYAGYVASYTLWARTLSFVVVFIFGCYWCILRLVAPKQAGNSISEWGLKMQAALKPSNGKMGRVGRTLYVLYC